MATTTTFWILELVDLVTGPMKGIKGQTDNAVKSMQLFQNKSGKAMDAIQSQVPGAAGALGMLANPYVAAAAGAVALGAAGVKSVKMANEWAEGMAKMNVTAQLSQEELKKVSDRLLEIGGDNVGPIEQIPEVFNKIISAGLDVNTALAVLEPTLRAAKAGFVDAGVAGDAAVSVMNSSGEDINKVYDVLFATMNKGKAEFGDISQYLPKLVPMARNAGFALGETAGAWAYLTAQGQTAERATTMAQNAMKALADPARIGAFEKMGISLYDSTGKIKPLTSIIDMLTEKTQGLSDLSKAEFFGKLGLDQEAASFFAVATQDAAKFKETIDFTTNSQGQLEEAYKNSAKPLDSWSQMAQLVSKWMIKLGDKALPIIQMVGEKVQSVVKYFMDLYEKSQLFRDVLSGIGTAITWMFKMSMRPLMFIFNAFKTAIGFVDELIAKIPGMGGGIEGFYLKVRPYILYIRDLFGGLANIMYKIATFDLNGAYEAYKSFKMPSIDDIKVRLDAETKAAAEEAKKKEESSTEIKGASPDQTLKDLLDDKNKDKGDKPKDIAAAVGATVKSITQSIVINNSFSVGPGTNKTDMDAIAEQVVRAINDKLRDGMVAAAS